MNHDEIEDILSTEAQIEPSPGFLAAVMRAVEREPGLPPLAFPWLRALPGFFALAAAFAMLCWQGLRAPVDAVAVAAFDARLAEIGGVASMFGLDWTLLAVAVAVLSAAVPIGLARLRPMARPALRT